VLIGIILGSKIFVNFTKYNFEECMRRLKHEIVSFEQSEQENKTHVVEIIKNPVVDVVQSKETYNWSEYQVENWLLEKKINKSIQENVSPCDGKILFQLYEMMNTAPEFFYSSIVHQTKLFQQEKLLVFRNYIYYLFKIH